MFFIKKDAQTFLQYDNNYKKQDRFWSAKLYFDFKAISRKSNPLEHLSSVHSYTAEYFHSLSRGIFLQHDLQSRIPGIFSSHWIGTTDGADDTFTNYGDAHLKMYKRE